MLTFATALAACDLSLAADHDLQLRIRGAVSHHVDRSVGQIRVALWEPGDGEAPELVGDTLLGVDEGYALQVSHPSCDRPYLEVIWTEGERSHTIRSTTDNEAFFRDDRDEIRCTHLTQWVYVNLPDPSLQRIGILLRDQDAERAP